MRRFTFSVIAAAAFLPTASGNGVLRWGFGIDRFLVESEIVGAAVRVLQRAVICDQDDEVFALLRITVEEIKISGIDLRSLGDSW